MLRGHKYEISDVETVQELQEALQKTSGVDPKQQGRVLFGGKRLGGSEILEEVGVTDGAKLNLVPGKPKTSSTSKPSSVSSPAADKASIDMSVDMNQMDAFMKSMGGGDNKPPSMQESMEMMSEMMNKLVSPRHAFTTSHAACAAQE